MYHRLFVWLWAPIVCASVLDMSAQESPQANVAPGTSLQWLARGAGAIFTGTVTSVRRGPARTEGSLETMLITFRVTHALRGARPRRDLTIREWSGLWAAGERYRVGERVLLFLYRPSKLGLTSPVAGPHGRYAVDEQGRVMLHGAMLQEVIGGGAAGSVPASAAFGGESAGPNEAGMRARVSYREIFRAVQRAAGE